MNRLQCGIDWAYRGDHTAIAFFRRINPDQVKIEKIIHLTPEETKLLIDEIKRKES